MGQLGALTRAFLFTILDILPSSLSSHMLERDAKKTLREREEKGGNKKEGSNIGKETVMTEESW